jgi:hypothetical protein
MLDRGKFKALGHIIKGNLNNWDLNPNCVYRLHPVPCGKRDRKGIFERPMGYVSTVLRSLSLVMLINVLKDLKHS